MWAFYAAQPYLLELLDSDAIWVVRCRQRGGRAVDDRAATRSSTSPRATAGAAHAPARRGALQRRCDPSRSSRLVLGRASRPCCLMTGMDRGHEPGAARRTCIRSSPPSSARRSSRSTRWSRTLAASAARWGSARSARRARRIGVRRRRPRDGGSAAALLARYVGSAETPTTSSVKRAGVESDARRRGILPVIRSSTRLAVEERELAPVAIAEPADCGAPLRHWRACPPPSSSVRSGATRARGRSSTCSRRSPISYAATRAARTPAIRSSSATRRTRSVRSRPG